MALSQDHLSRIVREHSGTTCKAWIERAVLLEAKVLLRHTDRTITDISEALHFPNDSFFCKYFKRLIGMTPRQYRERG
jgi:AraC-like DNA-binding protein